MNNFTETMSTNPPRLVVMFQRGDDGSERFQWGVVGSIPILSVIGSIARVQADLVGGLWIQECDNEQPALVIAWDRVTRTLEYYLHPDIPTLPLVGMLETIKAMLVASRLGQQVGSQKIEGNVLGLDGKPMRY
jgi:hypothetical protein